MITKQLGYAVRSHEGENGVYVEAILFSVEGVHIRYTNILSHAARVENKQVAEWLAKVALGQIVTLF